MSKQGFIYKKNKTQYSYQSALLKKAQVHPNFKSIVYRMRSYESPFEMFEKYFKLHGSDEYKLECLKSLVKFMEALENDLIDHSKTISYFPLYVLESRWLLRWAKKPKRRLNKSGRLWLEAMKETIALKEEELKTNQEELISS